MSARENILKAIALGKPTLVGLPEINITSGKPLPLDESFIIALKNVAAQAFRVSNMEDAETILFNEDAPIENVVDLVFDTEQEKDKLNRSDAHDLESVHTVFIKGSLGVAENGAIWVEEPDMVNRLLPFICEHLVIVLDIQHLVYTMHEAYEQIQINKYGYGVFIAGPSKTADIEQSLVIGAHGPRSLKVFLVG